MLSSLISLAVTSLLYFRRRFYEFFLKIHSVLALFLNALLWFHISRGKNSATACLCFAGALWLLQNTLWLCRLAYRNCGGRVNPQHSIIDFSSNGDSVEAVIMQVAVRRPWKVLPGQYVYITIPSWHRGGVQSHPYMIAWSSEPDDKVSTDLLLFIDCRQGFSGTLKSAYCPPSVIVDGPYGTSPALDNYDKVLFIAGGIGVAAHLLSIRHLLLAHNNHKARVRRLSFLWVLETECKLELGNGAKLRADVRRSAKNDP